MKGVKSRILKKLNSIPQVGYLNVSNGQWKPPPHEKDRIFCDLPISREKSTHESRPMRASNEEENKENINPEPENCPIQSDQAEPTFRPPDPNSATLFDPNLLAAFRQAVIDHLLILEEVKNKAHAIKEPEPPLEVPKVVETETEDPLMEFEENCPPRGEESIILYTTSLRGIRKTFEDCNSIRFLLESLKLVFVERDLSMHMEFREEVWRVLGHRAIPPRLFIKGRYIGGADEVLGLHEQGRLLPLVEGLPKDRPGGAVCRGCGGMRFAVCCECNGSRKVFVSEEEVSVQCRRCNENGLVVCPLCS